jgi:hypothetical protein
MSRVVAVLLAVVCYLAPASARAQSHPNFSGKWTLDTTALQGPMAPRGMTMNVTQDSTTLTVESAANTQMGDQKGTSVFRLDGSTSKSTYSTPSGALEVTSTGVWEGATFVVTNIAQVQGQPLQITERWSLGDGGKTLSLDRAIAVAGQNFDVKLTFTKQ